MNLPLPVLQESVAVEVQTTADHSSHGAPPRDEDKPEWPKLPLLRPRRRTVVAEPTGLPDPFAAGAGPLGEYDSGLEWSEEWEGWVEKVK